MVKKNSILIELSGDVRWILLLERTLLNFLQHLSSISTYTKKFVEKLNGSKTMLLDTRKTTTGLRVLEKYATKVGGAKNHRMGLNDKILIKDNHIKVIGGIKKTLELIEYFEKLRNLDQQVKNGNIIELKYRNVLIVTTINKNQHIKGPIIIDKKVSEITNPKTPKPQNPMRLINLDY